MERQTLGWTSTVPGKHRKQQCDIVPAAQTSFIHSFRLFLWHLFKFTSYYSEALPTQHRYRVGVSRRSTTGNCEWRTLPKVPMWRDSNPRPFQRATTPHKSCCKCLGRAHQRLWRMLLRGI